MYMYRKGITDGHIHVHVQYVVALRTIGASNAVELPKYIYVYRGV